MKFSEMVCPKTIHKFQLNLGRQLISVPLASKAISVLAGQNGELFLYVLIDEDCHGIKENLTVNVVGTGWDLKEEGIDPLELKDSEFVGTVYIRGHVRHVFVGEFGDTV